MDNYQRKLDNWLGHDDHFELSGFSHWRDWQLDFPILEDEEIIDAIPLMQRYPSEPLFSPPDLFEEFSSVFDEEIHGLWESSSTAASMVCAVGEDKRDDDERKEKKRKLCTQSSREERSITFEEVSKLFCMPITQAARELNVGLTLLKKKCRELGIPRWPHRKMKSLQTLIKNVLELEREEGEAGEAQLRSTIEILEKERKLMEKRPEMKLEGKTKRLRQACFKANYKKRRMMTTDDHDQDQERCASAANAGGYFCDGFLEYY